MALQITFDKHRSDAEAQALWKTDISALLKYKQTVNICSICAKELGRGQTLRTNPSITFGTCGLHSWTYSLMRVGPLFFGNLDIAQLWVDEYAQGRVGVRVGYGPDWQFLELQPRLILRP